MDKQAVPAPPKRVDGMPISMGFNALLLKHKLEYLDKLTDIVRLIEMTDDLKKVMVERMATVCNSIEKDLGLKEEPALHKGGIVSSDAITLMGKGDMKETIVPLRDGINTNDLKPVVTCGIVTKPGVSGVGKGE